MGPKTTMAAASRPLLKTSMTVVGSELGFVTSQLNGIKISCNPYQFKLPPTTLSAPFSPSLQPVASEFSLFLFWLNFLFVCFCLVFTFYLVCFCVFYISSKIFGTLT